MANIGEVTATLSADDKMSATIEAAMNRAERAFKQVAETSARSLDFVEDKMERSATAASFFGNVMANVAMKAISFGKDVVTGSLMAGARLEQLAGVSVYLGEKAGYSAKQINDLAEKIEKTGITGTDSRNAIVQLLGAHIDLAKASELSAVAQNMATISGESSSATYAKIIRGITTLQPEILKTAGFTINLETAMRSYTEETGKSAQSLNGLERQQLLLNAVLKEGAEKAGLYGVSMEFAAKQAGSSERVWQQVSEQIGLTLLPITNTAIKAWYQFGTVIRDTVTGNKGLVKDFVTDIAAALQSGIDKLYEWGKAAASVVKGIYDTWNGLPDILKTIAKDLTTVTLGIWAMVAAVNALKLVSLTTALVGAAGGLNLFVAGIQAALATGGIASVVANITNLIPQTLILKAALVALGYGLYQVVTGFKDLYDRWQASSSMWDFLFRVDDDTAVRRWLGLSGAIDQTKASLDGLTTGPQQAAWYQSTLDFLQPATSLFRDLGTVISSSVVDAYHSLSEAAGGSNTILNSMLDAISTGWQSVLRTLSDDVTQVKNDFVSFRDTIYGMVPERMVGWAKTFGDALYKYVVGPIEKALELAQKAREWLSLQALASRGAAGLGIDQASGAGAPKKNIGRPFSPPSELPSYDDYPVRLLPKLAEVEKVTKSQESAQKRYNEALREYNARDGKDYLSVVNQIGNKLYEGVAADLRRGVSTNALAQVYKISAKEIELVRGAEEEWVRSTAEAERRAASFQAGVVNLTSSAVGAHKGFGAFGLLMPDMSQHMIDFTEVTVGLVTTLDGLDSSLEGTFSDLVQPIDRLSTAFDELGRPIESTKQKVEELQRSGRMVSATLLQMGAESMRGVLMPAMRGLNGEFEETVERTQKANDTLNILADGFAKMGQAAGGSLGSILKGIGQMIVALETARKVADSVGGSLGIASPIFAQGASRMDRAAAAAASAGAVYQGATNVWDATSSQRTTGGNAMSGALAGAQAGAMFGPYGMAIGAAAGLVAGLIRGKPEWAKAADEVGRDFGVKISDALAKEIAESADEDFGGSRQAASIAHLNDIVKAAGGLTDRNIDQMTARLRDAFVMIQTHQMTIAQGAEVIEENFEQFAEAGTDAMGFLSREMREIIALDREMGTNTQAVTDYLIKQGNAAIDASNAIISSLDTQLGSWVDLLNAIGDAVDAADLEAFTRALDAQTSAAEAASEELSNLGVIAVSTFTAAVAAGVPYAEALAKASTGLSKLSLAYDALGLPIENMALKSLLAQNRMLEGNQNLITAVGGLGDAFVAMSNMGLLSADTFRAMEETGMTMYTRLQAAAAAAGGGTREALLPMQDFLHRAAKAAEELGIPLDDNTEMLIGQSKELGIWKEIGIDPMIAAVETLIDKMGELVDVLSGVRFPDVPDYSGMNLPSNSNSSPQPTTPSGGGDGSPALRAGSPYSNGRLEVVSSNVGAAAGVSGSNGPMIVQVMLKDGRVLAEAIVPELPGAMNRYGLGR